MSHTYEKLDGYKFLCKIFALISRNTNMREIFQENVDDISNTANDEIVMTYLAENWDRFCSMVLDSNPEIKDCILEHFNQFHPGKTKGIWNCGDSCGRTGSEQQGFLYWSG